MSNYILIDGSYFCFYRFFALIAWYRNAYPDLKLEDPSKNKEFIEKYKKTFISKLHEIPKKLKIKDPIIYVGKDCKRLKIWRMKILNEYKKNRNKDDLFMGGPFIKMAYDDNLFMEGGASRIFYHKKLEADDCLALLCKHLISKEPNCKITVITSDTDYIQLINNNTQVINLRYKTVNTEKNSTGDPKKDLFCKILTGDKTDNIPQVFKKCGIKTAIKCWDDKDFFEEKMKDPLTKNNYERNRELIDFEKIPIKLQKEFYKNSNL